ncbi:cell division cycle protein, putative [Trypanosoma brucei gambiense DAL972]|uniref:Cell division cycle protein, putative n=1 Tax=Trypanosoma brucei gambiense (strain MHOM/CI/86/DAL972) TaxID=679716 RepID=C9ZWD3_TRYB9|nr:cell division cycle protein, putative [Trypanosoma brucei gambiense DAL972]CBH13722.1 cell division cycle protein, putative [Trypanosoma brucei gambiense DAL972]|eukprot:XP_011775998.1 cell division cycle protein, putative [Trypanosoma brucei gambiense DAL972]
MNFELSINTPTRPTRWVSNETPSPPVNISFSTPDRFISDRNSQDNSISHFFLTTKENVVPLRTASGQRAHSSVMVTPPNRGTTVGGGGGGASAPPVFGGGGGSSGGGSPSKSAKRAAQCSYTCAPELGTEPYTNKLARTLFPGTQSTVLGINSQVQPRPAPETEQERYSNSLGVVFEENRARNFMSRTFRVISRAPERILDAVDMIDDFYLQLMDWSAKDVLAVGLQGSVYLWYEKTSNIAQLPCQRPANGIICGVSWSEDGNHLALGADDGSVEIWDVEAERITRRLHQHTDRVGALSWNGSVLSSGSKDTTIRINDLRDPLGTWTLQAHRQSVCGLRWSPDGLRLASGGNDNQLLLWDMRTLSMNSTPSMLLNKHTAAVKAIAWNPVQHNLLVSGGGSDDKMLRFWNTSTGECISNFNAESQVCGVLWNHGGTELVSSHGYSHNRLTIWKYPTMRRVADLAGHTSRVLHMCMSTDGEVVVSAAADETIRFWRCFSPCEQTNYCRTRHESHRDPNCVPPGLGVNALQLDTSLRNELPLR